MLYLIQYLFFTLYFNLSLPQFPTYFPNINAARNIFHALNVGILWLTRRLFLVATIFRKGAWVYERKVSAGNVDNGQFLIAGK